MSIINVGYDTNRWRHVNVTPTARRQMSFERVRGCGLVDWRWAEQVAVTKKKHTCRVEVIFPVSVHSFINIRYNAKSLAALHYDYR